MHRLIRVLCVDDNELIAEAIKRRLKREPDLEWLGWLARASDLALKAAECSPDVVVLDVDIPGDDSFEATRDLADACPDARVLMLSGHCIREYVDLAVEAGAWGYLLKSEETDVIVDAIRRVARGEFVLHPTVLVDRH